uniref:Uncharacterized protein TCIL3000_6_690 n=1 Tax=Trypanosoma congolense (strain IL3000) TaxID=1068625 RepID=G0UN83_TRYCI|nr:unnamed protein product [Trypanosoma congolense IL3000]
MFTIVCVFKHYSPLYPYVICLFLFSFFFCIFSGSCFTGLSLYAYVPPNAHRYMHKFIYPYTCRRKTSTALHMERTPVHLFVCEWVCWGRCLCGGADSTPDVGVYFFSFSLAPPFLLIVVIAFVVCELSRFVSQNWHPFRFHRHIGNERVWWRLMPLLLLPSRS